MNDPYETLGVARDASIDDIKKAFRKLSHQHHPDKGGDAQKFQEINAAYQILSNPDKRAQYDRFGAAGGPGSSGGPGMGGFDFSGFGGQAGGFGFSNGGGLGDIFEDIFGAAFAHIQAEVQISPAQAVLGDDLKLTVNRETIDFTIPPGTQNGQVFTFRGKGKEHRRGRGDLQLVVKIVMPNSRRMNRRERELWEELKRQSR